MIITVITQCSIRHLYATKNDELINQAKTFERRRCGHHELESPLPELDCLKEVVDGKENNTNKHRYVIASQDGDIRAYMRQIPGVPLIYINRSVMIMEPMAETTGDVRMKEERSKFRAGLKTRLSATMPSKRARDEDEEVDTLNPSEEVTSPQKRKKGLKGPNPLSMLKPKKRDMSGKPAEPQPELDNSLGTELEDKEAPETRKRKRKSSKWIDKTIEAAEILTGRKNLVL
jgi:U3 small nucleolar RNA-associated protein 23